AQRFRLGRPAAARGERLGGGLLLGQRVWDAQSRIRIHIGPVSSADHEALLPPEPRYRALLSLLRAYLPPHLSVELRFTIREEEDASAGRALGNGMRLGWTAWARSKGAGTRHASHMLPDSSFAGSNSSFNREA
ncbi:MAG: type VI secretion system baseplate subunit TssG, partial [Ectothiorhodospiraceae bacterium]|nr:type VI secretion system baseplate subunit TssG [Ectothiorhodospiraceae bacterium]